MILLHRWQRRKREKLGDEHSVCFPPTGELAKTSANNRNATAEETVNVDAAQVSFDYYAVVDFECTCDRGDWPLHEIIEFPAIFVNSRTREVDLEFHRFVRPVENPLLSRFCTELTGITQEQVDSAETLPVVLEEFQDFLDSHGLVSKRRERSDSSPLFVIATDGPWDIRKFLWPECGRKHLHLRHCWNQWVDIRRSFEHRRGVRCGVVPMLQHLGLSFQGREHSGLDDARNIARILVALLQYGELKPRAP